MKTVIVVQGLPGSGKTTFSKMLLKNFKAAYLNADQIRATISNDLGFSHRDRCLQAYRLGKIAAVCLDTPTNIINDGVDDTNYHLNTIVLVDFINPTTKTRGVFNHGLRIGYSLPVRRIDVWMDTISKEECGYKDTAVMFEPIDTTCYKISGKQSLESLESVALNFSLLALTNQFDMVEQQ